MGEPIVLVHGIFGYGRSPIGDVSITSYFRGIRQALRADGHQVSDPPQISLGASVIQRAGDLKNYLQNPANAEVYGKRVHIVAHSMGGLDARYLISKLDMAERVLSLTTIGTPHHGTPIADLVIDRADPRLVALIESLKIQGIVDLTTSKCSQFNRACPEAPQVRYYSVAGRFQPPRPLGGPLGMLGLTHGVIQAAEGDNDGLVSVRSATSGSDATRWTFLGSWEANHFRLVNWGTDLVLTPPELRDTTIVDNYRAIVARVVKDQAYG